MNDKTYTNNFIYKIINKDLNLGKYKLICTRFPPEPNGYLHIGHAKSIYLNFGIANFYNGKCNLRFDDTNPIKEHKKYINEIKKDIKWLGFNLKNNYISYSSDYFNKFYSYAIELISKGLAYVDELSPSQLKDYRGTLTIPGKNSPYRSREIKENLILFSRMRHGQFTEGSACLRAKINMNSPLMIMRDPVLYRIKFINHHKTGNKWCIYPTYDFAHCISDALEGITHSLCTLEFQDNRYLYNWILNNININKHPYQYEFSRLNIEYNITSKRKLKLLIDKKIVDGWDDPRILTIAGLRRRGYTVNSIRKFCHLIGITKQENNIQMSVLETCVRKDLDDKVPRIMAVLNPMKLIITNLPKDYKEQIIIPNHPNKLKMGFRKILFSKEIIIDRSDFRENNDNDINYKRLVLGKKVRLRNAYIIKAEYFEKDKQGNISNVFCTYDKNTLNKKPVGSSKVNGIIHWVSAIYSIPAEFRLYNNLFNEKNPSLISDFLSVINPNSLIINHGFIETSIIKYNFGKFYQFEREGYFCIDNNNLDTSYLIFNRIVGLKNSYKNKL